MADESNSKSTPGGVESSSSTIAAIESAGLSNEEVTLLIKVLKSIPGFLQEAVAELKDFEDELMVIKIKQCDCPRCSVLSQSLPHAIEETRNKIKDLSTLEGVRKKLLLMSKD